MKKILMAIVAMTMLIATSCKEDNVNALDDLTFKDIPDDAFCFTAQEPACKVTLSVMDERGTKPTCSFEYYDATTQSWASYTPGTDITLADVGDKAYFRAVTSGNSSLSTSNGSNYYHFTSDKNVAVNGNIMYLLDQTGSKKDLTLGINDYAFYMLFKDMSKLVDASGLILPAKTLAKYCYQEMFFDCKSLKAAPNLPATTLAESCYLSMFSNCMSLTSATDLHATTLADYCYREMFKGCSSLGVGHGSGPSGAKTLVVPEYADDYVTWGLDMFDGTAGGYDTPNEGDTYFFYDATQY